MESFYAKTKNYFSNLDLILKLLDLKSVAQLVEKIKVSDMVWIIGNGGSCATAEHFAEDLIKIANKPAQAVTNSSLITMSANDEGYENSFLYPICKLVKESDLVVGISMGGRSPNILNVISCDDLICSKFLITGLGGNQINCDKIVIPSHDYQILEDVCLSICHIVCKYYGDIKIKKGGESD